MGRKREKMKYILKESSKEIILLLIPFVILAFGAIRSPWVQEILGDISITLLASLLAVLSYLFFAGKEGLVKEKLEDLNWEIKYYSGGRIPCLRNIEVWEALFFFLLFCFAYIAILLLICWVYYKVKHAGSIPLFAVNGYICSVTIILIVKVRREIEREYYYR